MPVDVLLPKWGMGMNDGMIVKWLKREGDQVEVGDHLVEVESAKVNSEVESPAAGTLARIIVPEGMVIVPGTVIAVILAPGEEAANLPARMGLPATGAPTSPSPQPLRQPTDASPLPTTGPAMASRLAGTAPVPTSVAPVGPRQVTPIARRLAQQLGVNLDAVVGTGPGGRVTEDDVRQAASTPSPTPTAAPAPQLLRQAQDAASPAGRGFEAAGVTVRNVVPLRGMRGTIARRMFESGQAPTVTLTHEADVTATDPLLEQLVRDWRQHRLRPQLQDLLLRSVARALGEHARANSYLIVDAANPAQGEVREIVEVNLGFAVAVPDGLVVPVIRNADKKSLLEIAQSVRDITGRIKSNQLKVDDLEGGTFSVTNLGAFGVDAFNPLINPPQVGILGVGRVVPKPAVHQGQVAVRSSMWLSLTFDHRAWDGAPAAEFLRTVAKHISDPGWMVR